MNNTQYIPDSRMIEPELRFEEAWDAEAVSDLIRSKCHHGETPAFLFLGKREAELLRKHLADVFGAESVLSLKDTYYMGLEVVTIESASFFFASGRKRVQTLQDPIARRPAWRDRETDALWQLRL